jgi:CO/xanthine dehydrogenase Mo-binding subunit
LANPLGAGGRSAAARIRLLHRRYRAKRQIEIAWSPFTHVIGTANALRPDAPLVWPHRSNIVFDVTLGEGAATASRFRRYGRRSFRLTLVNQRLGPIISTRGVSSPNTE